MATTTRTGLRIAAFFEETVIPAKAGIQKRPKALDSRFHGNDPTMRTNAETYFEIDSS
jgi:hypothetical protein